VIVKNGFSTVLLVYQRHGSSKLSVSCLKVVCLYTAVIVSTTMMIHDHYAKEVDHLGTTDFVRQDIFLFNIVPHVESLDPVTKARQH
jgi:hypothetical protein